ncbi:MAG TPA: hypothetical protein VNT30_10125 [Stellaceae bacterium]|nr:hypothetical protein [Stellaceae bacterium]
MRVVFRCDPALIDHLPRPIAAREALPSWLQAMRRVGYSEAHGQDVRTVKQCPPFVDAMSHGFIIPLPCDVMVSGGRFSWDWDIPRLSSTLHPQAPLSFHVPAQLEGSPFHTPDQVVVKFNSFWTIELEPGWSLFATHPVNRADLPFRLLSGLVDADRFTDVGILFPAVWSDPDFEGVLPRGMPVAQCFAVSREPLALVYQTMDTADVARYDRTAEALLSRPGIYRKRFRAKRAKASEALKSAERLAEGIEAEE